MVLMLNGQTTGERLQNIYQSLLKTYGSQHWWPADEPFEMMMGAILTQSAAWTNVEMAMTRLKEAGALSPGELRRLSLTDLAALVYSSGYHNAKARKLKSLAEWLQKSCRDDLGKLFAGETGHLRQQLLSVWGIGQETADSILLYAAGKPVFVIDAYTRRITDRIGLAPDGNDYAAYQTLFTENLPADVRLFNEYHALLVCLGKNVCRKRPLCGQCCLQNICRFGAESCS